MGRILVHGLWARHFYAGLLITLLLAGFASARDFDPEQKVIAAVPKSFPPYYSQVGNGQSTGFGIDIMDAVAERAGIRIEYKAYNSWSEVFSAIVDGRADLIPNIGATDSRSSFLQFTSPVDTHAIVLFARTDSSANSKSFQFLANKGIGVVKLNEAAKILAKIENANAIVFDSFEQALFALLAGQIDVLAYPESTGWNQAKEVQQAQRLKVVGKPLAEIKRAIGVRKDASELYSRLDVAVKGFIDSGEYLEIRHKWLGQAPRWWTVDRVMWFMGSLFILLILLFIVWRHYSLVKLSKNLDKKLKEQTQELEFQKRALDEHAIVSIANKYGDIIYANQKFLDISGYTLDELLGKNHRILSSKEHPPEFFKDLWQTIGQGKVWHGDIKNRKKEGGDYWVKASIVPFLNNQGRPFQYVAIRTDITERKRIESELINSQQTAINAQNQAETASKAKSAFLSSMSHELRTPMNAILGFAQLLEMDKNNLNDEQFDSVLQILKGGRHLLALINEVLDLAKIESGKMTVALEDINLKDVINQVKTLMSALSKQSGIEIDYGAPVNYLVHADSVRLKQVLINLLSNAVKYNRPNGHVRVEYKTNKENRIRVSVIDTGEGLESDQIQHLFKGFERLHPNISIEGTGIGLAISKDLVELMGGEIGVESTKGVGSTFYFELEGHIINGEDQVATTIIQESSGIDKNSNSNGKKILYIEDNLANLRLVEHMVQRQTDYRLFTAEEPMLGLELAEIHKPDLILLDINLPDIDGYEVLSRLRNNLVLKDIPVYAVSANALHHDIEKGLAAGFDQYISKPIDLVRLLSAINESLA